MLGNLPHVGPPDEASLLFFPILDYLSYHMNLISFSPSLLL